MEKQQQILQMAKDICRVKLNCNDVCNPVSACDALKYAERAVEAGYSKQSEIIDDFDDLLIDFDEMGFCPTTAVPDPDAYAREWKRKLVDALQGYRKQEWIPVAERLPEEDTRVLVYLNSNHSLKVDTDRMLPYGMWARWQYSVTHWMPLPEAPKGGDHK